MYDELLKMVARHFEFRSNNITFTSPSSLMPLLRCVEQEETSSILHQYFLI